MKIRSLVPLLVLLGALVLPAGAFSPPDCPGLTLWVRADAGVTAEAGGHVSAWADQSGHGNDFRQADPKLQPQLVAPARNGLPALRFDGVADALALATAPLPLAGTSVFAVLKWDQVRAYSFALGLDAGTDGYLRMSDAKTLVTGGIYPVLYQNGLPFPKAGYPAPPLVFHYVSSSLLRFNVYAITDNPPSNEKLKYLGMNEFNNEPTNRFAGQIAEVLVYDRALTLTERQQVEEYLGQKYLAWPPLTTVPLAATAAEAQSVAAHFAAEKPLPVTISGPEGGILAHGTIQTALPAGRYRLHGVVDAAASPTVAYSVRFGSQVRPLALTPGGAGQPVAVDFIQPPGAPPEPTLVRFSWESSAAGAPPPPETATVRGVYLETLSPLVVQAVAVDKILYAPGQPAAATATVANYAAEALPAQVRFTEITGLDDRRLLGTSPVTVPAGGLITVTVPYNVGALQYGRDLLVEVVRDGKVVEANSTAYSVADNLWKVAVGAPSGGAVGSSADYSEAGIVKELQGMPPGYCNWLEVDFWAPDDWGLMVTPPGATWYSGQARRHENTEKLQLIVKTAHDLGMKAITYGKCMAGGLPGWELARKQPQWFSVDAYGRTEGRPADVWDQDHWQEDKWKYNDFKYDWTYRWVDLRLMAPLDHGIDQLLASTKEFGWDGVRYDSGGFRAHLVDGKFDGVDSYNARNMRYTKERVWKADPSFLFGYNTNDPVSSARPDGGSCPLLPTDPCGHEFREMMAGGGVWMFEGMRDKPFFGRVTYPTWSACAQDMMTTVRTLKGYGGQACCSYGDTELYKFIIGTMVGCHDYAGEHLRAAGSENWGRFLTRWSSFLWDDRLRALPEAEKMVAVQAATPLWWKQFANTLVTSPSQRYVIVNLLNPPVHDEVAKTGTETPAPVNDCTVTLTVPAAERLVSVWFLAPGYPNRAQELTPRAGAGQTVTVTVPRLDIWGLVVWDLRGTYTVPSTPPALTEPLSPAELAEMERCKPTGNVPVADNLLNPTPQFDPTALKHKDSGPSTVTPPTQAAPGGQPGRDVLLVNGFYHYTYRLGEALQRWAPGVRVHECTTRDLPKDYPDLWRYDVIVLVDMGADAWDANGQRRLADFAAAGGRLVVLGGPFTLGQGFFSGTALESVLPVTVRVARDVYQLPQPVPLGDHKDTALAGRPLLYYYHAAQPRPDAQARLWGGELPLWYEHHVGKGSVAVFLGTTMGQARQPGEVSFWEWDGWPALEARLVLGR